MPDESVRISFALPVAPQSLRAFVEKAATNKRFLMAFVESPLAALHGAGVPIRPEGFTEQDFEQWFIVFGKLQELVASGKIARDFQFEQVFNVSRRAEASASSKSTSYGCHSNFHSNCTSNTGANNHATNSFGGVRTDPWQLGDEIIAPLLSPGNLATIATLMLAQLKMGYGTSESE